MTNKLSKYQDYLVILLLALTALIIYLPSISAPFIFDDNHMIVNNLFIKNHHFFGMFFKGYVTSYPIPRGMLRPLLMLTFAFNYLCGGLNPIGYHIINILFHFLNAVLLFTLLKLLSTMPVRKKLIEPQNRKNAPSGLLFLITLLFVVHPINTEAVTYISSRSDLMVTFFILSGFILYLKERYFLSVTCYALALLTKETALIYPILIGGYFLLYTPHRIKQILKNRRLITFILLIAIVSLGYLSYKSIYFGGIHTGSTRSVFSNILIQSWVTFFYIRLFLWPDNLNFFHVNPDINSFFQPQAVFFAGVIILIILVFILRKRGYLLSLGLFLYITGLIPKFYALLKVPVSEHHFYLPGAGIYIILAAVLIKPYIKNKRYFLYPAIGTIFIFTTFTIERNFQLTNPFIIWKIGTEKEPRHPGNWINLAIAYYRQGNPDKAEKILKNILRSFDKEKRWQATTYSYLASIYFDKGENTKAINILKKVSASETILTNLYTIHKMLGIFYAQENNEEEAMNHFNKAIELNSYSYDIYRRIGKFYIKKNKLNKAEIYINEALKIKPDDFYSYFLKGKIYEKEGNLEKAKELYKKSIETKPDWFQSHYALCKVYIKQNNPLFIKELKETLRLKPAFRPALKLTKALLRRN